MTKPKMASPKVKSAEVTGMVTFHCVVPREGKRASALYAKKHDYFVGRAIPKDYKPTKILSIEFDFINIWSLTEYKNCLQISAQANCVQGELCINHSCALV